MFCIIYKITNLLNGKCYIGQTWQSMKKRLAQHTQKNDSIKLFNAIKKCGVNSFSIECITIVNTQENADYFERYFVTKYRSNERKIGYNISNGGKGVGKHSTQTKKKISDTLSGRKIGPFTKKHKSNMSLSKMGHLVVKETKEKISQALIGRSLSEAHAKNIGIGHTGLTYKIKDPTTRNRNISEAKKKKNAERRKLVNI